MNIVIDVVFVLFMALMFFFGFRRGFLTKAWWLLDIGLIVVFGLFLTPSIKQGIGPSLTPALESMFASLAESGLNMDPAEIADIVTSVIIWVGIGIIVIILMAILKAVLRRVNEMKFFGYIDKILGGIYGVAISLAIIMVLGALAGTFVNFEPMKNAADFCNQTYLFKYVFGSNPFQPFADQYLPLGTWIAGLIPQGEDAAAALLR